MYNMLIWLIYILQYDYNHSVNISIMTCNYHFCVWGGGTWSRLCDTSSAKWESKKLEDSALWFWGFILLVSEVIEGEKNHKAIYISLEFCLHGSDNDLTWVCRLWTFKLLFWRESLGYLYFFNHLFALSTNSMSLNFFLIYDNGRNGKTE